MTEGDNDDSTQTHRVDSNKYSKNGTPKWKSNRLNNHYIHFVYIRLSTNSRELRTGEHT
jgi:hypothetical protein